MTNIGSTVGQTSDYLDHAFHSLNKNAGSLTNDGACSIHSSCRWIVHVGVLVQTLSLLAAC